MTIMTEAKQLPIVVSAIFKYLNKNTSYAVLRNSEGLPLKNKSRDIDILIPRQQYEMVKKDLVGIISDSKFKLVSFFESERICTFVCGQVQETSVELVQFDFFFHTSAYGVILISSEGALHTRVFDGNVYHVTKEYEFLDKYLYLKYLGQPYPKKYEGLEALMLENPILNAILEKEFGIHSYADLNDLSTKEFRKSVNTRNRKLFDKKHILNQLSFRYHYLKNAIFPKGFSIGFTGPDGSGKTTVIERLKEQLLMVYPKVSSFHFRPIIFGNLGDVAYSLGVKKDVDHHYDEPHRGGKTGIVSSLLRLMYYSMDYVVGYFKRIRRVLVRRELVIFDRYYTDIICDSRRSRIYLPPKFLYGWGRLFIPSLDYNILLTASTDTILARKRELDSAGIDDINAKIDYLSDKRGYYKVINESTPQSAVAKILHVIFEQQHKKNVKRLK